jgi:hypothetical protein
MRRSRFLERSLTILAVWGRGRRFRVWLWRGQRWLHLQDRLDGARRLLWTGILDLIGWEHAAVLTATRILTQLEFPIRGGRNDSVPEVVKRGHRALDELTALR